MKTLIEKWNPVLTFKFEDGLSVTEDKYQECSEYLEFLEEKFKDKKELLKQLIVDCTHTYAKGMVFILDPELLK
jgi:hypothetical protein